MATPSNYEVNKDLTPFTISAVKSNESGQSRIRSKIIAERMASKEEDTKNNNFRL